jgi:hypothetical protein
MKKVLSPDMVAHAWANQTQTEARNAGNTLYFYGDKIYSYGSHFCIAKHVTNDQGERATLFTTRGYSVSTSKHISIVRNASNHLNVIYCNDPAESKTFNIEKFERDIKEALHGLYKARKPEKYISNAQSIFDTCIKYCEFFDIEAPDHLYDLLNSAMSGKYKDYLIAERERIEKEKAERDAKALKESKNYYVSLEE